MAAAKTTLRQLSKGRGRMTDQEIRAVVDKLADVAQVLSRADVDDKSEIFRQLGLKLTYRPEGESWKRR